MALQTSTHLVAALVFLLCSTGCVRRDGRNSDCRWPAETAYHPADAWHLSADAEFAEDLAIRYADAHHGLRSPNYVSGEAYAAARDRCMGTLFQQIAKEHGVPVEHVSGALGRNRVHIDVAVNLPFVLLCCFAAVAVARTIWRRYPPAERGWVPGVIMALFISPVFAAGSTTLGEMWAWVAESWRIGNDHMSYRVDRLLWATHRTELFAGALIVFWLAAIGNARHVRSKHSLPADRAPHELGPTP
jgi:hypothetical protein